MHKKHKSQKTKDDLVTSLRTKSTLSVASCCDDGFPEMRTTSLQEGRQTTAQVMPLSKRNCHSYSSLDSLAAHGVKPGDEFMHQTTTETNNSGLSRPTSLEEEMEDHVRRMQTSFDRWQHMLHVSTEKCT